MKKVFSSGDRSLIEIVRRLLHNEGIEVRVLNEHTASVLGDVPFFKAYPELWVRTEDQARADRVVAKFESGESRDEQLTDPWTCPGCGETIEGQFTECWNCTIADPRREEDARCTECGYRLRGLPDRRCPECGTRF